MSSTPRATSTSSKTLFVPKPGPPVGRSVKVVVTRTVVVTDPADAATDAEPDTGEHATTAPPTTSRTRTVQAVDERIMKPPIRTLSPIVGKSLRWGEPGPLR